MDLEPFDEKIESEFTEREKTPKTDVPFSLSLSSKKGLGCTRTSGSALKFIDVTASP